MNDTPSNGTIQNFDGKDCIYYDGYWIRNYDIPEDTLANRKRLIDSLTRRTFHHTEAGINTPGDKLESAREAFESESDPAKKRVNGAMLAGALFNRATDIFTAIVDLEEKGVRISRSNELMRQCADCFKQALELGKQVKHYSGQEGIDELWGEPLKAFSQPLATLFESRYRKIAASMRDIESISDTLKETLCGDALFSDVRGLIEDYATSAKRQIETMKSDTNFFKVWPEFIAAREALERFRPASTESATSELHNRIEQGTKLIASGAALITYLSEARVPMPKSSEQFLMQCESYKRLPVSIDKG
ncbi:MAG: hypothetical protein ABW146_11290 [Candidatus Sedimenticola sp. 6PFRAG7]